MINKPIVSVITPVYNASKFIPRLLECVAKQENILFEHIFVDDCSKDDSYFLLQEAALKNPYIKVIKQPKNFGPVNARNLAIKHASGKYLAFLDADDYWMPKKLNVQVRFMEMNDAAISFTDYRNISEDGTLVGRRISGYDKICFPLHCMTRYIGCLTVMLNREKVVNFEFPDISPARRAEDFLAWGLIISQNGPALRCPHDLARYSIVANSRSSFKLSSIYSVWKIYRVKFNIHLVTALLYFMSYSFFSFFKAFWYKPMMLSHAVDAEHSDKYLLGNTK